MHIKPSANTARGACNLRGNSWRQLLIYTKFFTARKFFFFHKIQSSCLTFLTASKFLILFYWLIIMSPLASVVPRAASLSSSSTKPLSKAGLNMQAAESQSVFEDPWLIFPWVERMPVTTDEEPVCPAPLDSLEASRWWHAPSRQVNPHCLRIIGFRTQ